MSRPLVALLVVAMLAGACGGSGGNDDANAQRTAATDLSGNPLRPGEDWSGRGDSGSGERSDPAATGNGDTGTEDTFDASVPYGCGDNQGEDPPPEFAHPLGGQPQNDFVLKATVQPVRADAGEHVTIDVVAAGAPEAVAVIVASFYDGEDHGMKAAKFTDKTGRTQFKGPIPSDAPLGWAAIAVSVTTRDSRSAIDTVNLVVTGEGCE